LVDFLTGSFFGLRNFGIVIVPEVLESFCTCPTGVFVTVAPLVGADYTDGVWLVTGRGDESRPCFSGRGLELAK
jgi:hypothetical protein